MKNLDYSTMSVDELILLDKVDISQVIKYFKEDIIALNKIFFRFRGFDRRLIIGQWVVLVDYSPSDYEGLIIKETIKIANYLADVYCYPPEAINKVIDEIKTERMALRDGLNIEIITEFEAYNENTLRHKHTLNNSCMNGCGDRYYTLRRCLTNPEDLKICVARDSKGNLVARSLIWKNAYFDRVYGNSDTIIHYVKRHLSSLGYESVYYSPCVTINVGVRECLGDYRMPYLDSVCYYIEEKGILSNSHKGDGTLTIQEVDGESWYPSRTCACCGGYINTEDSFYISRTDEFVGTCCEGAVIFAVDTDEYEYIENCRQASDTDEWYYDESELYYTVDTDEYYANSDDLYYATDTCEWYETADDLYYNAKREIYIKGNI